jgi:hypothetical protein
VTARRNLGGVPSVYLKRETAAAFDHSVGMAGATSACPKSSHLKTRLTPSWVEFRLYVLSSWRWTGGGCIWPGSPPSPPGVVIQAGRNMMMGLGETRTASDS